MKLSTAIRIGSMTTKQIQHSFNDGKNGRCALGAAADAAGINIPEERSLSTAITMLLYEFPILSKYVPTRGPIGTAHSLMNLIIHLNDAMGEPRESIADLVESIENEMEAKDIQPTQEKVTV